MERFAIVTVQRQQMVWDHKEQKRIGDVIALPDQQGRQRLERLAQYLNHEADQRRL